MALLALGLRFELAKKLKLENIMIINVLWLMGIFIREIIRIIKCMEKEHIFGLMEIFIKEVLRIIKNMEKANILMLMEIFIKEIRAMDLRFDKPLM